MKLFGNRRGAAHLGRKNGAPAGRARRWTGTQKGILLMAGSLLVLAVTVIAVYKDLVKPPELPTQPTVRVDEPEQEEESFRPPTVIQIETKIDEETGEEVQVETEVPASHK